MKLKLAVLLGVLTALMLAGPTLAGEIRLIRAVPANNPGSCDITAEVESLKRIQGWVATHSSTRMLFNFVKAVDCLVLSKDEASIAAMADLDMRVLISREVQQKYPGGSVNIAYYNTSMRLGACGAVWGTEFVNDPGPLNVGFVVAGPGCVGPVVRQIAIQDVYAIRSILRTLGFPAKCSPNLNENGLLTDPSDILYGNSPGEGWNYIEASLDPGGQYYMKDLGCGTDRSGRKVSTDLRDSPFVTRYFQVVVTSTGDGIVSTTPVLPCSGGRTCDIYPAGVVEVTATPAVGNRIREWTGPCAGQLIPKCSFELSTDTSVSVSFEQLARPEPNLSITISGRGRVSFIDAVGITGYCTASCKRWVSPGKIRLLLLPAKGSVVARCTLPQGSTGKCTVPLRGLTSKEQVLAMGVVFKKK